MNEPMTSGVLGVESSWNPGRTSPPASRNSEAISAAKRRSGLTVSVVVPVFDPARDIGESIALICTQLAQAKHLVDELLVFEYSSDGVAVVEVDRAGAMSVRISHLLPEIPSVWGWGDAVWRSLRVVSGDVVVWLRSNDVDRSAVAALVGPLCMDPAIAYVRGFRARRRDELEDVVRRGFVELFPELAGLVEPFMGSSAGRASILAQLPLTSGASNDVVTLIDLLDLLGIESIAQADLSAVVEGGQPRAPLSLASIARLILRRASDRGRVGRRLGADVRALFALAAEEESDGELERIPMRFAPRYVEALRSSSTPPRRPIHSALVR